MARRRALVEMRGGFWFPDSDKVCHRAALSEFQDADFAVKHVRRKKLCVQAGGNCGVWAKYLATIFEEVWTFEPDFENYLCLVRNVPGNVFPFFAGLGHKRTTVGLDRFPENCGAHQVNLNESGIPLLTIDDLKLPACDLIILDIEGFEPLALDGARGTISDFKPIIMVEDKDISRRYGFRQGWPERELPGYRVVERTGRDVILAPI